MSCLENLPDLPKFMDYCCRRRHHFFEIKQCGKDGCEFCKPHRLSQEIFEQVKPFPDPEPGDDDHYKSFPQIYGRTTSEKFRPSFNDKPKKKRTLPFRGKLLHVRNADLKLESEECCMWRLVYAKRKFILFYFILLSFATRAGSPQQREPITVGL